MNKLLLITIIIIIIIIIISFQNLVSDTCLSLPFSHRGFRSDLLFFLALRLKMPNNCRIKKHFYYGFILLSFCTSSEKPP